MEHDGGSWELSAMSDVVRYQWMVELCEFAIFLRDEKAAEDPEFQVRRASSGLGYRLRLIAPQFASFA